MEASEKRKNLGEKLGCLFLSIILIGILIWLDWPGKAVKAERSFWWLLILGGCVLYLILQRLDGLAEKIDRLSKKIDYLINRLEK
jgi:hypothetical protein